MSFSERPRATRGRETAETAFSASVDERLLGWRLERTLGLSRSEAMLRLCRLSWDAGLSPSGRPMRSILSLALRPALFRYRRGDGEVAITLVGLRIHARRVVLE